MLPADWRLHFPASYPGRNAGAAPAVAFSQPFAVHFSGQIWGQGSPRRPPPRRAPPSIPARSWSTFARRRNAPRTASFPGAKSFPRMCSSGASTQALPTAIRRRPLGCSVDPQSFPSSSSSRIGGAVPRNHFAAPGRPERQFRSYSCDPAALRARSFEPKSSHRTILPSRNSNNPPLSISVSISLPLART
jgi:hypothetical protein